MNSDKKIDTSDTQGQASVMPKSNSRRRLLQAGIGASPVVLSVIARPVRAAGGASVTCRSASSFASAAVNPTSSKNPSASCTGDGPAWWRGQFYNSVATPPVFTNSNYWPAATEAKSTFVAGSGASYSVTSPTGTVIVNPMLAELLAYSTGTTDRDKLARNIAAARLNVANGGTPASVIPPGLLSAVWQATQGGGTYSVSAGINWNAAAVNTWLVSTFNTA